jgi:two-component system sensor histidine kinase RegB
MAAVILGRFWTWTIATLSMLCFALLFVLAAPDALLHHHQPSAAGFNFHLQGMWVAFAIAAALVAHFLGRLTAALRDREQRLQQMHLLASQQDRLAALTNLAAGAAHELGSPLSTIAIVAGEVSRGLERGVSAAEMRPDIDLIRAEVGRCKTILEQMSGRSGEVLGEMPQRTNLAAIYSQLIEALALSSPEQLQLRNHIGDRAFDLPVRGLVVALKALVKNALESVETAAPAPVRLTVTDEGKQLAFIVSDYGSGIPSEVLARIGEPFFTTKEPGRGMGLGLFLARLFAERLGGSLTLQSAVGVGTTVTITVPKMP